MHRFRTQYLVDASGRDTLLASKLGSKRRNRAHQSAAIFSHYRDVALREGRDAGNISICWFAHGWIWMIPLHNDTVSIGVVCRPEYLRQRKCSQEAFLEQTLALSSQVVERIRGATRVAPVRAAANYSYRSNHACGRRYVMVGDAFTSSTPYSPVVSSLPWTGRHVPRKWWTAYSAIQLAPMPERVTTSAICAPHSPFLMVHLSLQLTDDAASVHGCATKAGHQGCSHQPVGG